MVKTYSFKATLLKGSIEMNSECINQSKLILLKRSQLRHRKTSIAPFKTGYEVKAALP